MMYKVVETKICVGCHRAGPKELNHFVSRHKVFKKEECTLHLIKCEGKGIQANKANDEPLS